jgi:hypothetical protein
MEHASRDFLLRRLAQNTTSLAEVLHAEHRGLPQDAERRPALIVKLTAALKADFAALFPKE